MFGLDQTEFWTDLEDKT